MKKGPVTDTTSIVEGGCRGKAVLVTGATAGIGFAIAERFAQCGATVAVTGRNGERGAKAARCMLPFRCFVRAAVALS